MIKQIGQLINARIKTLEINLKAEITASEERMTKKLQGVEDKLDGKVNGHVLPLILCYNFFVIITQTDPYTKEKIEKLREEFDVYIKTVIDIKRKLCSAGANRHFESEKILLDQGSRQSDLWGGGIDLETKVIDYNSFINIRPNDNNRDRYIQDPKVQGEFKQLSEFFFQEIL